MPQSGFTLLQSWFLFCCLTLAVDSLSAQEPEPPPPANPSLTLIVEGVDGPLHDNVLAFLELNRFAGKPAPGADLTLVVHRRSGETLQVPVTCRLDTAEEVSIYEAGGVLQRFAQDFLAANKSTA